MSIYKKQIDIVVSKMGIIVLSHKIVRRREFIEMQLTSFF